NAEGNAYLTLAAERRDDRVERTLVPGQHIRTPRLQAEQPATVLQGKARAARDNARAERIVVALDIGDHVPLRVHDAQIRRVRPRSRRPACLHPGVRL